MNVLQVLQNKQQQQLFYGHFPAYVGLASGFSQQFLPLLTLLRILPFQTTLSHVPLYYMTPRRPWPCMLFFTQSPSSFRNTCPSHLNQFTETNSIPILSLSSALGTLSVRDTVRSNLALCSTFTFPFSFKDTSFLVKIPDNSLNFHHGQRTLTTDAESAPPPHST